MKHKYKPLHTILMIVFIFFVGIISLGIQNINMASQIDNAHKELESAHNEYDGVMYQLDHAKEELANTQDALLSTRQELSNTQYELGVQASEVANLNQEILALQDALFNNLKSLGIAITQSDIDMIAKTVLGEAGNCTTLEQSAVIWCILNRVDASGKTIAEVVAAPNQFHGYNPGWVVKQDIYALTIDVLTRWQLEKVGVGNVGRTLPSDFLWFHGDGKHNYFRNAYSGDCDTWNWNCWNPYS